MKKDSFKFLTSLKLKMAVLSKLKRRMAGLSNGPAQCCHFALAKHLAEEKKECGVQARDKLVMDTIEQGQRGAPEGFTDTDKGRKMLKSVHKLVRAEVENCGLHGFVHLEIVTKNSRVIGGFFLVDGTCFNFLVDKNTKGKKMSISVEKMSIGSSKEGCEWWDLLVSGRFNLTGRVTPSVRWVDVNLKNEHTLW